MNYTLSLHYLEDLAWILHGSITMGPTGFIFSCLQAHADLKMSRVVSYLDRRLANKNHHKHTHFPLLNEKSGFVFVEVLQEM